MPRDRKDADGRDVDRVRSSRGGSAPGSGRTGCRAERKQHDPDPDRHRLHSVGWLHVGFGILIGVIVALDVASLCSELLYS